MCPSSTSNSEPAVQSNEEKGLIGNAPQLPRGGIGRFAALLVCGLFLFVCFGTGLVDTVFPAPKPQLIGGEKVKDDQLRARAKWFDGSLAKLIEYDLRLTSRVRSEISRPYNEALYYYLNEAKGKAVAGDDGWLFLLHRARPPRRETHNMVALSSSVVTALARRLGTAGVRMMVIPVPRKAVAERDKLPPRIDPRSEIERAFEQELERRGLPHAKTLDVVLAHTGDDLYFKTDSHWTETAELLIAEEATKQLGLWIPPEERRTRIEAAPIRQERRDLLEYIGIYYGRDVPAYLTSGPVAGYEVITPNGKPLKADNPRQMTRVAICGTSFTARRRFPRYLSHFIGERVWNMAEAGRTPVGPLYDRIVKGGDLPEILLLEIPAHMIFEGRPFPRFAEICSLLEQPSFVVVGADQIPLPPALAGKRTTIKARTRLATIKPGQLAHTGDGVVEVRLRGKLARTRLEIEVFSSTHRYSAQWSPGQDLFSLPLVTGQAGSRPFHIFARPVNMQKLPELALEAVELALPAGDVRPAQQVGEELTAKGWERRFALQGPLPTFAAGWAPLRFDGQRVRHVRAQLTSSDGALLMDLPRCAVRADGTLALNLGATPSPDPHELRIFGDGLPPEPFEFQVVTPSTN